MATDPGTDDGVDGGTDGGTSDGAEVVADGGTDDGADGAAEPLVSLPEELRGELKDPMGAIETDAGVLLESVSGPLIAVGDVVTYHFLEAGREPDVALVDERTKRTAVDETVERAVTARVDVEVSNPPAILTEELIRTLRAAIDADEPRTILVDGEEDLAALPAIIAAPDGASVVYGQPDVGMVHVRVDEAVRSQVADLLERFDGDTDRLFELLA